MIEYIRETFIEMINQSTWMDLQSKVKAIDKVRATFDWTEQVALLTIGESRGRRIRLSRKSRQ